MGSSFLSARPSLLNSPSAQRFTTPLAQSSKTFYRFYKFRPGSTPTTVFLTRFQLSNNPPRTGVICDRNAVGTTNIYGTEERYS